MPESSGFWSITIMDRPKTIWRQHSNDCAYCRQMAQRENGSAANDKISNE